MKKNEIKQTISECCNDLLFTYSGKDAIITSTVKDYAPTFEVTYGDKTKKYNNVDDVMSDKFYNGKSINDLADTTDIEFICA